MCGSRWRGSRKSGYLRRIPSDTKTTVYGTVKEGLWNLGQRKTGRSCYGGIANILIGLRAERQSGQQPSSNSLTCPNAFKALDQDTHQTCRVSAMHFPPKTEHQLDKSVTQQNATQGLSLSEKCDYAIEEHSRQKSDAV